MDNRPIGVFDSGLGGLTCVKELMKVLPGEDIIYLGDTGRVPYGTRSRETIIKYTMQDIAFLEKHNVKRIVIACGTVSSVALDEIDKTGRVRITGVIDSAVAEAVRVTKNGKIGVMGTPATIASGSYEKKLLTLNPNLEIMSIPCPMFVPLVENGYIEDDNRVLNLVAQEYIEPLPRMGVDTVILGCTHYPLIQGCISKLVPDAILIDPGKQAALSLAEELMETGNLSDKRQSSYSFYVTDSTESFTKIGSVFLNRKITGKVERIEL